MIINRFAILSAGALALGSVHAQTILIDNFNTAGFNLQAPPSSSDLGDIVPATDTTLVGSVVRDVALTQDSGSGFVQANNAFGYVDFSNPSGAQGTLTVSYTLATANDLTSGNSFSFVLVNSDSGTVNYTITVTDSAAGISVSSGSIPIVPGVFSVLFSNFSLGADFSDVVGISFQLDAQTNGADASVDAFGINLPPVPEASTYAAVGFMGLAAFGAYRRARK